MSGSASISIATISSRHQRSTLLPSHILGLLAPSGHCSFHIEIIYARLRYVGARWTNETELDPTAVNQ